MKALTGSGNENIMIRQGTISVAPRARLGYLEQKGVSGSTKTVREEVASRMDRLQAATQRLERAEHRVSEGDASDEALIELEEANAEFDSAGGFTGQQKIGNVLSGLGFQESDYDRYCAEFSGGWQMRIALARLLLSEPDLLLDEPSNHLDKAARAWLGTYLAQYDGTLLIVSHDTQLLGTAASSIAEVRAGRIELYKSRSHEQWLVEREERVAQAQSIYDANQREIERLQKYVDRFGAKTMGASLAQSKMKTIDKLTAASPSAPVVSDGPTPFLKLPPAPRGSKILLDLRSVSLAWPPRSIGAEGSSDSSSAADTTTTTSAKTQPCIINDCSLTIERGMRIAVRGPNGAGKSTLLSALSGALAPSSGTRSEGDGLALGVFTQDLAQDLDQAARAVEVVTSTVRLHDPSLSDQSARSALGALGLTGEKSLRVVGHLSGGEKARVALASFVLIPHNLLLLDEPSNHLDGATIAVLTAALRKFDGASMVISHDREFLEKLEPTHVITVRGGRAVMEERGLRETDWDVSLSLAAADGEGESTGRSEGDCGESKFRSASSYSDKKSNDVSRQMKKIENSLEKYETELKGIDNEMMEVTALHLMDV